MRDDTEIGGPHYKFPPTRRSAIVAASSVEPAARTYAVEILIRAYWKPIYKHIRLRWNESNENAKDLTQSFFARAIEKDFFGDYDHTRGSFRTFLRTCVDHFVANERKFGRRQKRAEESQWLSLDFDAADGELQPLPSIAAETVEEFFKKEWMASLFSIAVDSLERECESAGKRIHFRLFEKYDLEEGMYGAVTYEQLAREFGIAVTDVTNYLAWTRRQLRRIVLEQLKQITGSDQEFRNEARLLFGVALS